MLMAALPDQMHLESLMGTQHISAITDSILLLTSVILCGPDKLTLFSGDNTRACSDQQLFGGLNLLMVLSLLIIPRAEYCPLPPSLSLIHKSLPLLIPDISEYTWEPAQMISLLTPFYTIQQNAIQIPAAPAIQPGYFLEMHYP